MSLYNNPGKLDVEQAARDIVAVGGVRKEEPKSGYKHVVVYVKNAGHDRHLSWDEYPDGTIKNVHTTGDSGPLYTYGN